MKKNKMKIGLSIIAVLLIGGIAVMIKSGKDGHPVIRKTRQSGRRSM